MEVDRVTVALSETAIGSEWGFSVTKAGKADEKTPSPIRMHWEGKLVFTQEVDDSPESVMRSKAVLLHAARTFFSLGCRGLAEVDLKNTK